MSKLNRITHASLAGAMSLAACLALTACDQNPPPRPTSSLSSQSEQNAPAKADSQGVTIAQASTEETTGRFLSSDQIRAQTQRGSIDEPTTPNSTPADTEEAPLEARLTFEKLEHDFGAVFDTEPVDTAFKFRNTGNAPLRIDRVHASCGCTATKLSKQVFAPGEEYQIEVSFRPQGAGVSSKYITVASNDPKQPSIRLRIGANVVPPVMMEPNRLMLGTIKAGQSFESSMTIMARDPEMEIVEIVLPDLPGVTIEAVDYTGDILGNEEYPGRKTLVARVSPDTPTGSVNAKFTVRVLAAAQPGEERKTRNVDGFMSGLIRGDLVTTPRFLRITESNPAKPFEARALLSTESGAKFTVTKVEVANSALENVQASFQPAPEEGGWWIIVKGTTTDRAGAFRGEVIAYTDLDEGPKPIIFNGIVRTPAAQGQNRNPNADPPTRLPQRPTIN